jgi:hypothetical protein
MTTRDDDDETIEVVDKIVADLDPPRIEREARRLGVTVTVLLGQVVEEMKARLR